MDTNKVVKIEQENLKKVKTNKDSLEIDENMFKMINENAEKTRMEREYERVCAERDKYRFELHRIRVRQERKKKAFSNFIMNFFTVLGCIMIAWMFLSWVNVICNNTTPGGFERIWDWNFFKVMTQLFQK